MIKVKELSSRHKKTLADVLTTPPKPGIKWDDVVSLINTLGGKVKNGNGSRRKFVLMGSVYQTHQVVAGFLFSQSDNRERQDLAGHQNIT